MTKILRRFSNSSEATVKKPTDTPLSPSTEVTSKSSDQHESEESKECRRKNAYYWYKLLDEPKKGTMCRIVEYTKGPDFTRQDIDLLPWNFNETKVAEEAMKSPKKKEMEKEEKKKRKMDMKAVECSGIQHTALELEDKKKEDKEETKRSDIEDAFELDIATVLNDSIARPTLQKGQVGESWRSLDFIHCDDANKANDIRRRPTLATKERVGESWTSLNFSWNENGSSCSLDDDGSYDSWEQDHIRDQDDSDEFEGAWLKAEAAAEASAEAAFLVFDIMSSSLEISQRIMTKQLQTVKVEEEDERKKGERQLKMEAAREQRVARKQKEAKVDMQKKKTADDTTSSIMDARRERAFQWYAKMATPSRRVFKQKVAAQDWIDIKSEDVDLLPWNATGSAVNIAKMNALIRVGMQKQ